MTLLTGVMVPVDNYVYIHQHDLLSRLSRNRYLDSFILHNLNLKAQGICYLGLLTVSWPIHQFLSISRPSVYTCM